MIARETNRRIDWLMHRLRGKRYRISDLLRRLAGLGPASGRKLSLFRKFLRIVDEISAATAEESSLLDRIQHVEREHDHCRRHKKLRRARFGAKAANLNSDPEPHVPAGDSNRLLKLLAVWWVFSSPKRNQKKQGLTAD